MRQTEYRVRVGQDGRISRTVSEQVRDQLLMYAGRDVIISVRRAPRSIPANKYYWGVVISSIHAAMVEAGVGCSAEDLHHIFKDKYLQPSATADVTHPPTTTTLDQFDFWEYIQHIRHDEEVLALGVHIPDPEELNVVGGDIHEIRDKKRR